MRVEGHPVVFCDLVGDIHTSVTVTSTPCTISRWPVTGTGSGPYAIKLTRLVSGRLFLDLLLHARMTPPHAR
ncbi:hypothetical protein [Streptomyces sp. NPDC059783]|uniref:hypothetical protein n=1 Tax=Streptomyces sp. NPDC059783 TaxID=3346944 RepID=UPI003650E3C8